MRLFAQRGLLAVAGVGLPAGAGCGRPGSGAGIAPSAATTAILRPASWVAMVSSSGRSARAAPYRPVLRSERDDDAVAFDVDALRLRDDRAVEELLRPSDLFEERLLEAIRRDRVAPPAATRRSRPCFPAPDFGGDSGRRTSGGRGAALGWRRCRGRRRAASRPAWCERRAAAAAAAPGAPADGSEPCERPGAAVPPRSRPSIRSLSGTSLRRWIQRSSVISRWKRGCIELRISSSPFVSTSNARIRSSCENSAAAAFSRSRSPSAAISGSASREGSIVMTSRSRVSRPSSRSTVRRS